MKRIHNGSVTLVLLITYAILTPTLFRLSDFPFDSDEAVHALDGLQVAADVYHRNGNLLLEHLYFTQWYPPLLSTYLAPFFLILKPTYWSARYPILLLTMAYLALIYRTSKFLSARSMAGLITLLLTATSPFIWIHSLLCMEEMLAMIGALLTLLAYVRVERHGSRPFWIGVCLAFTLLTKLPIGVYTAGAVFLAIWFGSGNPNTKLRFTWKAFAPLLVVSMLWWAHPAKIQDFVNYVRASPPVYESLGWQEISHYWKAMATTYTVSPLIGLGVLVSIANAFFQWRDPSWRLPLAIVLVTWLAMLFKRQQSLRFFMSAVPMAFLLAGNGISKCSTWSFRQLKARRMTPVHFLIVIALVINLLSYLGARIASFPFLMEIAYETDLQAATIHEWIANEITRDSPTFLVNGWDQFSTSALDFYLCSTQWPHWGTTKMTDVFLVDPQANPQAIERFQQALDSSPTNYIVHLGNTPVPNAGAWWAYQATLQPCWEGNWQAVGAFWIHLWDTKLENEILTRPFHYAHEENRSIARQNYWYSLLMEVKVAMCQDFDR